MKINPDRKMYMGVGKFMLPIPLVISNKGLQKGVSGAKAKAGLLSEEEQKVHHFVVKKMADVQEPITAEFISEELGISLKTVVKIIKKLEVLKTFLYRSDGTGINWAYPLSLDNTGHRMTVSTGEQFYAA
ncbi:MAG: HTH domain-containing protein [Desulfobulbaceae bacterium]|nr:HTH domain-containing protein [Desulfobulbaceae bacterium]